jgi:polysaccharide transporter, PST family
MQEKLKSIIPKKIRSKFTNRPTLQKIVKNIGWLTGERILELIVALTVGIWVARYLGPADYGLMSFAIAFTSLFSPFINLGLDTILNRELVEKPEKTNLLLGTVFRIKLISSIFIGFLLLLIIYLIKPTDFLLFLMVGIFAFGKVIKSFDDLSKYFASKIESEKKVKSNSIALILRNCLKVFGLYSLHLLILS